ncbi:helicase associated domain-containing protein [Streptomyces sp. NPDC015184]|uniref:helicase associated domain-containing protein n=1 Tax=Streptomyces sp. NPDC015184 TaxID=3364946 RepID=UPI0036FCB3D1
MRVISAVSQGVRADRTARRALAIAYQVVRGVRTPRRLARRVQCSSPLSVQPFPGPERVGTVLAVAASPAERGVLAQGPLTLAGTWQRAGLLSSFSCLPKIPGMLVAGLEGVGMVRSENARPVRRDLGHQPRRLRMLTRRTKTPGVLVAPSAAVRTTARYMKETGARELRVPYDYVTPDDWVPAGFPLETWLADQRKTHKAGRLDPGRVEQLGRAGHGLVPPGHRVRGRPHGFPRLGGRARASPAFGNRDRRVTEGTNAPPRRVPAHERALRAQERELESGHRRTAGDHARVFEGKT